MLAAARGRLASLRWRVAMAVLFAGGVGLVLDSALIALGWFAALCAGMGADYGLGRRYLAARPGPERRLYGLLFTIACAASIMIYAAIAAVAAFMGGGAGVALAFLMAASSLVSIMLFLFQAPAFMVITAAPCTIMCLVVPFAPFGASPGGALEAGFGVALAVAAFLAYVVRSALNSGKMFHGLETANRIAQERQAEAEARQIEAEDANRAKGEFMTTMTHELRTPLNAVIGYSEIIHEDLDLDGRADLAQDARRITAAARHLLGLIDQILQLTNMDQGRSHLEIEDVDVRALVEAGAASIAGVAQANKNHVALRIAPDVGFARTDGDKLALCIGHLAANAAKFTQGGLVAISAERERMGARAWLRIVVSDTGAGMRPEQVEKAFQPFTQLDGSVTRAQGGMGLGLPITVRTAKLLRGELAAVSEPGVGSTFTLRIPMRLADDFTIQDEPADAGAPCAPKPLDAVA